MRMCVAACSPQCTTAAAGHVSGRGPEAKIQGLCGTHGRFKKHSGQCEQQCAASPPVAEPAADSPEVPLASDTSYIHSYASALCL